MTKGPYETPEKNFLQQSHFSFLFTQQVSMEELLSARKLLEEISATPMLRVSEINARIRERPKKIRSHGENKEAALRESERTYLYTENKKKFPEEEAKA